MRIKQKTEIEDKILGIIYNSPELLKELPNLASPKDFSSPSMQLIWDLENPTKADIYLTLRDMIDISKYDEFGGVATLKKYIDQLHAINESIKLDEILDRIKKANQSQLNPFLHFSELNSLTEEYLQQKNISDIVEFDELFNEIYGVIETEIKTKTSGLTSKRFPQLNKLVAGGFRDGNLIGIAGAYKSGKTTFATSLLIDFATQNIPSCLFSLELSKREIMSKIIAYETKVPYENILEPNKLTDSQIAEINRMKAKAKDYPLYIIPDLLSLSEVKSKIRQLRDKKNVRVFFVDYLGYIQTDNTKFDSREREMTFFSNYLKRAAKELDVKIFIIAQLNRAGLSDPSSINLAESIGLARDCDYLMTISPLANITNKETLQPYLNKKSDGVFIVKLDTSRHSEQGKSFPILYQDKGMVETEIHLLESKI